MEALSRVSSWWVPISISSLAASSCGAVAAESREAEKPSVEGEMDSRRRSTESRARSARTLTVFIMSSRRAFAERRTVAVDQCDGATGTAATRSREGVLGDAPREGSQGAR